LSLSFLHLPSLGNLSPCALCAGSAFRDTVMRTKGLLSDPVR
jgi:hypothetical protein